MGYTCKLVTYSLKAVSSSVFPGGMVWAQGHFGERHPAVVNKASKQTRCALGLVEAGFFLFHPSSFFQLPEEGVFLDQELLSP